MEQDKNKSEIQTNEQYLYRWDYREQQAYDVACAKRKKKKGVVTYAVIMSLFFLACIALLVVTVLWLGGSAGPSKHTGAVLSTVEVAEKVNPAVVLIYAADYQEYGSGFFVRTDGYIATNAHFIVGCENIIVSLHSGEEYEAEVIGYSAVDDLAVLRIPGKNFPTVTIGNSDAVRVGETAIALGNPSGNNAPWSTTQGIISAVDRIVLTQGSNAFVELTMIQTDAPVNHGNSGGPLCNDRGEVIGIVTRKLTGYESLGLALPINGSMELINAIIQTGSTNGVISSVSRVRPTIGITGGTIEKGTQYVYGGMTYAAPCDGIIIQSVSEGSPADGVLQVADIIVAFDGLVMNDMEIMTETLYGYEIGDRVIVTVIRNGERIDLELILGKVH